MYNLSALTGIFDDFHTRYPRIEIRLDVAPWREILNSLKKGEIELAIGFADELDDRYLFIPITKQPQQLYCGPKHQILWEACGLADADGSRAFCRDPR